MLNEQFIGIYSDKQGKRVIKLLSGNIFYARKYLKIKQDHTIYASKLFLERIANKFSCIKQAFECNVSNTSEDTLTVTSPFYEHQSLLDYMADKSRYDNLTPLLEQIILVMLRGQNQYFYTYQNLFFNPYTLQTSFSPFSIVGLIPLNFKTGFSRQELAEVYQLLDVSMFNPKGPIQISYKTKFKAIGMMVLHFIFKKRISLILEGDFSPDVISYEQAKKLVEQLKDRFLKLLTISYAQSLIQKASERDKVDYFYFLKRVFIDNCHEMTWKNVKEWLIPTRKSSFEGNQLTQMIKQRYNEEEIFVQNKLRELGILYSEPQIYLVYKLQLSKLNFDKPRDLITREKYISSQNMKFFKGLTKLIITNDKMTAKKCVDQVTEKQAIQEFNQKSIHVLQSPHIRYEYKEENQIHSQRMSRQTINEVCNNANYQIKNQTKNEDEFTKIMKDLQSQAETQKFQTESQKQQIGPQNLQAGPQKQQGSTSKSQNEPQNDQAKKKGAENTKENISDILKLMCNNFKTNVIELKGVKIHAIDPKMAIINRFLKL